jgi:hypothetical protein
LVLGGKEFVMPHFLMTAAVDTTIVKDREPFQYPTLEFARVEARHLLARLVAERLPLGDWEMISVEIYDESTRPLTELRISMQEIEK